MGDEIAVIADITAIYQLATTYFFLEYLPAAANRTRQRNQPWIYQAT
jgi:hypothetical protein